MKRVWNNFFLSLKLVIFMSFIIQFSLSVYTNTVKQINSRTERFDFPNITSQLQKSHNQLPKNIPLIVTDSLEFLISLNTINHRDLLFLGNSKLTEEVKKFFCLDEFLVLTQRQFNHNCSDNYKQNVIWEIRPFKLVHFSLL
jgi:hypothetical protein